jgi:cytoskeletal protein RodZ
MYCATWFPALTIADLAPMRRNLPDSWGGEKNASGDDWGLRGREHRLQIQHPGGMDLMGDKVALPSLSLPKQRTHWSVGVVIAAAVLLIILGAAFYTIQVRQREAEEAFAKRQTDHTEMLKAEAQKATAEAERASAEAKKKEAEAAASNAAVAQSKAAQANGGGDDASKNKGGNKKKPGGKKPGGKTTATTTAASGPAPVAPGSPPKPSTKASKDIDDLLKGFK